MGLLSLTARRILSDERHSWSAVRGYEAYRRGDVRAVSEVFDPASAMYQSMEFRIYNTRLEVSRRAYR
jgi:hypothetical protein